MTPMGVGVLAFALAADTAFVMFAVRDRSAAGRVLRAAVLGERRGPRASAVVTLFLVRELDGFSIIDDTQSAGELAKVSQERPGAVVQATYLVQSWSEGPWAPWESREVKVLTLTELSGRAGPDAGAADAARIAIAGVLDRRGQIGLANHVREGDIDRTTIVWWGIAHDVAAGGSLMLLLLGLPGAIAYIRTRARDNALARERCPGCGYDLRGVPDDDGRVCPECGANCGTTDA